MKKAIFISSIIAVVFAAGFAGATSVRATSNSNNRNPIEICHSRQPQPSKGQGSGPQNNPYGPKTITVDGNAISQKGHDTHDGPVFNGTDQDSWGDIIPPFKYGNDKQYPGMNWTTEGQAIYNNNCQFKSAGAMVDLASTSPSDSESNAVLLGKGGEVITLPETGGYSIVSAIITLFIAGSTASTVYMLQPQKTSKL